MITDAVLRFVLGIVSPVVSFLAPLNIVVNNQYFEYVMSIVKGILYFLPVGTISTILGLMMATWLLRVVIAFLRALWSILPIV